MIRCWWQPRSEIGNYGLTLKVLQLSYNHVRANDLIDRAAPYLLDIGNTLGETTNLQELDGSEIGNSVRCTLSRQAPGKAVTQLIRGT
jgi:DNA-binding IclR family transcriptional regulator